MSLPVFAAAVALIALTCSPVQEPPDAGESPDAGGVSDGGFSPDGGFSLDGGFSPDGGISPDGGFSPDGSFIDRDGGPDGGGLDAGPCVGTLAYVSTAYGTACPDTEDGGVLWVRDCGSLFRVRTLRSCSGMTSVEIQGSFWAKGCVYDSATGDLAGAWIDTDTPTFCNSTSRSNAAGTGKLECADGGMVENPAQSCDGG